MVSAQVKDIKSIGFKSIVRSTNRKSSLEKRLKRLSLPCVRKRFLAEVHEQLSTSVANLPDCFPYACVEALDILMVKLLKRESLEETPSTRYPQMAVVEGEYHFELKPKLNPKRYVKGSQYISYPLVFLGKQFTFLRIKDNGATQQTLSVDATLEGKCLTFSFYAPSNNGDSDTKRKGNTKKDNENISSNSQQNQSKRKELITKEYALKSYPVSSWFKKNTFENSVGVALKRTDPKGNISLTDTFINLGKANANRYVIIFFGGSENYYFDLNGDMLFETLSINEIYEKNRISKALDIEERIKKFRVQKKSNALVRSLKHKWRNNPEYYQNSSGLIYITNGELITKTDSLGDVNFSHVQKRRKINKICVGVDYPDETVKVVFAGSSIAVYNDEGILNAHQFYENIHIRYSMSKEINDLGLISIITLSENCASWRRSGIIRTIGNTRYIFSAKEISERYGTPIESVKYVGIITNNIINQYTIFLMEEDGRFTSLPATPRIVTSPRYAKRSVNCIQ